MWEKMSQFCQKQLSLKLALFTSKYFRHWSSFEKKSWTHPWNDCFSNICIKLCYWELCSILQKKVCQTFPLWKEKYHCFRTVTPCAVEACTLALRSHTHKQAQVTKWVTSKKGIPLFKFYCLFLITYGFYVHIMNHWIIYMVLHNFVILPFSL